MKKLEKELVEKKIEIEETNTKLFQSYETFKKFDIEKTKLDSKINDLTKENKILSSKLESLENISDDKTKMIQSYQESLIRHEKESASLAGKLAQLKNAVKFYINYTDDRR